MKFPSENVFVNFYVFCISYFWQVKEYTVSCPSGSGAKDPILIAMLRKPGTHPTFAIREAMRLLMSDDEVKNSYMTEKNAEKNPNGRLIDANKLKRIRGNFTLA